MLLSVLFFDLRASFSPIMRNKYATISDIDRQRIIEASLSCQKASMIANVMGVKRTTIASIISKFTKEGRVEIKQRDSIKLPKITEDQKNFVEFCGNMTK
uniref:Uncharacterized protein n=1 Tax=Plectus sambesii TaxID=2011161 RepID=A0A914UM27_9BILA